jgi:hypothetical protein
VIAKNIVCSTIKSYVAASGGIAFAGGIHHGSELLCSAGILLVIVSILMQVTNLEGQ